MTNSRRRRSGFRSTAALAAALAAGLGLVGPATALLPSAGTADCGLRILPSLDASGTHPGGELLDVTNDGVYAGAAQDASGELRAAFWREGVAHQVPVDLVDGFLNDVNEHHQAVGEGYDPVTDSFKGYVYDLDSGAVQWLPGIGGFGASARRINEQGVAVGGGDSRNGTFHPLRWSPPYTSVDRLSKVGGSSRGEGAWAAGINDRGDIVGSTVRGRMTPDKRDYGGLPAKFHFIDLDAIAWTPGPHGLQEAGPYSHSWAVNNAGRAVGFADDDSVQLAVASWWSVADGRLHRMGSPIPGMYDSLALGVSSGGWATGQVRMPEGDDLLPHAFVWTGSGDLLMLPVPGGRWDATTSNAHGVNDLRDEVAGKVDIDGAARPAVWRCASTIGHTAS